MPGDLVDLEAWDAAERAATEASQSPHTWVNPHADQPCDDSACMWCVGGLEICSQCHAFEGATPTECPRRSMTADESDAVYHGLLDFRQGAWQRRAARWIENSAAWGARPSHPPAPLVLTGLPDVGDGPGHRAAFNPETDTSWCFPDCAGCQHAIAGAVKADACS